ncbi:PREDICTED: uncharacterized protein LOC105143242 [Acromyrmex echinatior]|uniref:uncharacterized protein LOC105143242 n=1 Tax=Acromyrmex echinatior TaxID=103372 RepID=UPI000580E276|nr:PREDICTED: uncharacterized protein LOC105143242 [Acromyrmex echinatior]
MWPRRDANGGRGSSAADNEGNYCVAVTNAQLYQAYPTVAVNNHNDAAFRRRGTVTHKWRRTIRVHENAMETDGNERTKLSLDGARVSEGVVWICNWLDHRSLFQWIGVPTL